MFIGGVPMNWATNRSTGWSYSSIGVPHLHEPAVAHDRRPIAHRQRLDLVVRD